LPKTTSVHGLKELQPDAAVKLRENFEIDQEEAGIPGNGEKGLTSSNWPNYLISFTWPGL